VTTVLNSQWLNWNQEGSAFYRRPQEHDMNCPQADTSGRDNYFKSQCLMRQRMKGNPCYNTTCKTGIALSGIQHVPEAPKPPVLCACGKPSMSAQHLKQYSIPGPICAPCNKLRKINAANKEKARKLRMLADSLEGA